MTATEPAQTSFSDIVDRSLVTVVDARIRAALASLDVGSPQVEPEAVVIAWLAAVASRPDLRRLVIAALVAGLTADPTALRARIPMRWCRVAMTPVRVARILAPAPRSTPAAATPPSQTTPPSPAARRPTRRTAPT